MSILFSQRKQGADRRALGVFKRLLMFFVSHIRQAVGSLGELWRQPAASFMTVAVLGLSITLPGTMYIMVKNIEKMTSGWDQAAEISLFLSDSTQSVAVQQLVARLSTWPEIESVVLIPADQALNEFKALSGLGDALAYLPENPLPNVVLVTPSNRYTTPQAARELLEKLLSQREVEQGKLDVEWLERLYAVVSIARDLVLLIGGLLFVSVVLIIGNTIRLNILSQREQILVMKLVGATDAFIHRPFLYTGFWFGFLGGMLAWVAIILILWWMDNSIQQFAQLYDKQFQITGLTGYALFIMLGISVALGVIGSAISVHRHVREIEPR